MEATRRCEPFHSAFRRNKFHVFCCASVFAFLHEIRIARLRNIYRRNDRSTQAVRRTNSDAHGYYWRGRPIIDKNDNNRDCCLLPKHGKMFLPWKNSRIFARVQATLLIKHEPPTYRFIIFLSLFFHNLHSARN